jgi:UDP-2-acetamido-2-deoxy-ribo-hexuluronate aminotransferase
MEFVDLKAQYRRIGARVDARMRTVLEHQRFILGPEVAELEERLAARVGARHSVTCASGTDALLLALMALGVGRDEDGHPDEVITTPFTFFATGEMITLAGAKPVFVDVEPVGYNLDPSKIEAAISPGTRAILPVSLYGQTAEMDVINQIAERHGLAVIEDAAQSFGALYRGRHSGNLSTIGCTSFFPSKPLGCYGDGGACFTQDDALAGAMRELRNQGQAGRYRHTRIGINGRLDTLQAAVLLAKLEFFDEELTARAEIADRYTALLKDAVRTPRVLPERTCVWAQYTIEVEDRAGAETSLRDVGIPTAVHYPVPLHLQPVYAEMGLGLGSFPVAERAAERVLSLPMHPYLAPAEVERVAVSVQRSVLSVQKSG